ncbi:MAG: glycosyltransferase [Calditrichaeota bacterium]|nr:glycosyltransferase [Calditrichota bacterium]
MKVVIVSPAYPHRGGIAHFTALLFNKLQERGHDVHIISFKRQYPSLFFPGKTQFENGEQAIPTKSHAVIDSIGPGTWFKAAHEIRQINPDLLIFQHWMPFFAPAFGAIAGRVKKGRKTKVLFICHNIIPHEPRPGDKMLTHYALSKADHFIIMSKAVQHDLLQFFPHADFRMVHHPVYEIFENKISKGKARKMLGLESGPVILFFGYIRRYKGLHILLEALKIVGKDIPVKLLVAGEFYEQEDAYLKEVHDYGLAKNVVFYNKYVANKDVGLYFSAADVVALPYLSATQSGIVQICYHYDKPVIATDVGGLPEVVQDGETGFVVPANDARAFANAIVRFFKENREETFSAAVKSVKKNFSWDRMAEAVESFM